MLAAGFTLLQVGESEAGPPSPSEPIVLGFELSFSTGGFHSSGRPTDALRRRAESGVRRGRPTGWTALIVSGGINTPYIVYCSAVIRVNLAGGSVTATIGTSLTFGDGLPYYTDPATGSCVYGFFFGGPTFGEQMGCAGPITAATGIYSQASGGWLELRWAWHQLEQIGSRKGVDDAADDHDHL